MKAMILAAGRGTRLLPLTEAIPKPMIPISSEPMIVHQIRWLRRAGISEIVINLHHLAEQVTSYLGTGADLGVHIQYSVEEELLDTGGGIVQALPLLGSERFVLLNSDVWTSYRFQPSDEATRSRMHLVLVNLPDNRTFGDFSLHEEIVVRNAREADRNLVFTGISYIQPEIFEGYFAEPFSIREVLFDEVAKGNVTGEFFDGVWFDVGTHDQLKALRRHII